jgi:broad specificity phosphatase PhoE
MASDWKRIIVCRHGARRSDGSLSKLGRGQARGLAEALRRSAGGENIRCIVTSALNRAVQTGEIVRQQCFQGIQIFSDCDLDEERFHQSESTWTLCVRIQRVLGRLVQIQGDVVVITHSGWIFACFRLMGLISPQTPFAPVRLASMHTLNFPVAVGGLSSSGRHGWLCEPSSAYAASRLREIPYNVSLVPSKWKERPSKTFGASRVVRETPNWVVKTDVWNMEKHKAECVFEEGYEPLMAISIHGGQPLACLRDLRMEHLDSLLEINALYPDEEFTKFILYPPWVYRLHIHIYRKSLPLLSLPCRNVHLLDDVISLVRNGVSQNGCMLVYNF